MTRSGPEPPGSGNQAEDLDPSRIRQDQFLRAAAYLDGLKEGMVDFLNTPRRTMSVCFPIEMADGSVRTFRAHRVVHNTVLGPGKGGYGSTCSSPRTRCAPWPR
jgi:glutamate dehydrogenase (NAD(P)+)